MLRIDQSIAKKCVFKAYLSGTATPATGKTIAITISKNGAAFGNPAAGATNATEISSGWYFVDLGTGDTGTLGPLAVRGAVATIDDVGVLYEVGVPLATQASVDTIDDFLDTEIAAIKAKTDNLPASPAATGDIPSAASVATAVLTTQMTESYAADGAAPTLAQAQFQLTQYNQDRVIATTVMTVKKLDGTTQAMVIDLDDAVTPTSVSRSA